ncbi:unnamed protein product [Lepeophtheirus salmonis]|uniref:(salmon louse) hypothetical protein n=1 Tax=Lepeophtheirus salmonis TaxID=72036 RepID=A0A7R8CQN8_LEPSM|nr:unnamed protein product [Lepeophtheirus salmonis]CAF2895209.1 unnamed protein product [Lepeophtheirus salmonis]
MHNYNRNAHPLTTCKIAEAYNLFVWKRCRLTVNKPDTPMKFKSESCIGFCVRAVNLPARVQSGTTAESVETDPGPEAELPLDISNYVEIAVEIQSDNLNIVIRQTQPQPYQPTCEFKKYKYGRHFEKNVVYVCM